MTRRWRRLVCVALLSACRSAEPLPAAVGERTEESLASGWRGGDEVEYLLSVAAGDRTEPWRVGVRLLDPLPGETLLSVPLSIQRGEQSAWLESALLPVHVRAAPESEVSRVRHARSEVPEAFLRSGLARVCGDESLRDPAAPRTAALAAAWERARAALDGLALAVSRNPALVEPLGRAVDLPNPLVLLFHDGPFLRFELPPQRPEPSGESSSGRLWSVRATLLVADEPAFDVVILVADLPASLESPLVLGAGVHSLHARSLREPARSIDLELVAARRGTGPPWILPAPADLAGERRDR